MDNRLGDERTAYRVFYLLLILALVLGFVAGACTVSIYADSCDSLTTKYTDNDGGPDVVCGNKGCFTSDNGHCVGRGCKYVDEVQP